MNKGNLNWTIWLTSRYTYSNYSVGLLSYPTGEQIQTWQRRRLYASTVKTWLPENDFSVYHPHASSANQNHLCCLVSDLKLQKVGAAKYFSKKNNIPLKFYLKLHQTLSWTSIYISSLMMLEKCPVPCNYRGSIRLDLLCAIFTTVESDLIRHIAVISVLELPTSLSSNDKSVYVGD